MEVITPELVATQQVQEVTNDNTPVTENMDFGVRFPLATMLNRVEIIGRGNQSTLGAGRHIAQLLVGLNSNTTGISDDINSEVLALLSWQAIDSGTPGNTYILGERTTVSWMELPPDGRPITVDGFTCEVENTDSAVLEAVAFFVVRYQIVRLTSEEFASRRAALPAG